MTEMQQALQVLSQIKGCHLVDGPGGRWRFVGRVPQALALVRKDGREPTQEDFDNARRFGPNVAGMTTRTWATREEALAALAELEG